MANGKWTCSHACANGKVLKNGKQCKHRCCHEGLDKPRKMKKRADDFNGLAAGSRSNDGNSRVKDANSGAALKSMVSQCLPLNLYPDPNQNADHERSHETQGQSKGRYVLRFGRG
jgi:ribosome assembly protein YihI (activator of Der GTPase)